MDLGMAITQNDITVFKGIRERTPPHYNQFYGMDTLLRDLVGIPSWVPLDIHLDHGLIIDQTKPDQYLAKTKAALILVDTIIRKKMVPEKDNVHVLGSLFMRYRRKYNFKYSPSASGTIVFPSHSSHHLDLEVNWREYAKQLKSLSEEFQPVTVCIYWIDVMKGEHKYFEEEGLEVITNGHMFDPNYAYNFYSNLSRFKYATGNEPGSFLFYALEMGMPFFLFGPSVRLINDGRDQTANDEMVFNDVKYAAILKQAFNVDLSQPPRITESQSEVARVFIDDSEWLDLVKLRQLVFLNSFAKCKKGLAKRVNKLVRAPQNKKSRPVNK
jgi:hypothetical protein